MSKVVKWRRIALAAIDALVVAAALWCAYMLRFAEIYTQNVYQYLLVVPVFIIVRLLTFWAFRLYRGLLRYAGMGEMLAILGAIISGAAILAGLDLVFERLPVTDWLPNAYRYMYLDDATSRPMRVPIGVIAGESCLSLLGIAAVRFSRRILIFQVLNIVEETRVQRPRRLAIVGAGDLAETALRQIQASPTRAWKPVAMVDDDAE
jgi:FlaA1/EpsC-like NDP-sugar epimerase